MSFVLPLVFATLHTDYRLNFNTIVYYPVVDTSLASVLSRVKQVAPEKLVSIYRGAAYAALWYALISLNIVLSSLLALTYCSILSLT